MTNEDRDYAVVHVRPTVVLADGKVVRGHPAGTIAVAMTPDDDGHYPVGVSFRNPKDRWDARIGRTVAVGRLRVQRRGRIAMAPSSETSGDDFRRTRLLLAALQFVEHVLGPDLVPPALQAVVHTATRFSEGLARVQAKAATSKAAGENDRRVPRNVPAS